MSVDALVQVFRDHREVSPGVQAVLIALAWRTPQGRDSTVPTSARDVAFLTRQHEGTARRNLLEAVRTGAAELAWAKPGQKSRYRVNRGEWWVSGTPDDLAAALELFPNPAHDERAHDATGPDDPAHNARTSSRTTREDRARGDTPLRIKELEGRLREKGLVE